MKIQVTAVSGNGGPNLDNLSIQPSDPSPPSGAVSILTPIQGLTSETTAVLALGPTLVPTPVPTLDTTSSPTPSPVSTNSQPVAVNNVIQNGAVTIEYRSGTVSGCSEAVDGTTNVCPILRTGFEKKSLAGIVITPPTSNQSIVKKLRVYTNNNFSNWDPISYKISGRNSESEPWSLISEGATGSRKARNNLGVVINSTFELGDPLIKFVEVAITNSKEYWQYQILFPTIKDNSKSWLSFGEVELPGYILQSGDVITT
eukprot:CAMPEP_0172479596 /NCGR_PEP_ID=MMETSP1066-20121228/4298_1 /TAXON_ID=671091 /ORGANISM="Coscinodiscus wailesii, Strain CCMP2513" /LENGTH=257 /DNA_ID=CAMNT_0013240221 /DNA_START=210 /DNA_END=983 /DNA_ORIENTATION=-